MDLVRKMSLTHLSNLKGLFRQDKSVSEIRLYPIPTGQVCILYPRSRMTPIIRASAKIQMFLNVLSVDHLEFSINLGELPKKNSKVSRILRTKPFVRKFSGRNSWISGYFTKNLLITDHFQEKLLTIRNFQKKKPLSYGFISILSVTLRGIHRIIPSDNGRRC